ncbi:MAG TPA: FAD-dependent oxidoreductase, partial [Gammaproteobacteria bacterium]|nr:FAD-dependent oxidoreductase [Gammaproteobacteria bacterium]
SVFKKFFVLRRAKKELQKIHQFPSFQILDAWLHEQLKDSSLQTNDLELAVSLLGTQYIANLEKFSEQVEKLTQWCAHALHTPEAKKIVAHWTSFRIPVRLDYQNLVPLETRDLRFRDGFALTDPRMNAREAQDEVNYCIYCHDHDGDFCSKGFPAKKGDPSLGFKKNPLDVTLTGCPLEEKISEMNILKRDGFTIAALAMVMVDNPMCPATGHRICNDCMKACIYQKQEPVNSPQIETRVLVDVLNLPWGVEIYDLLTRFNPLRKKQWIMKPYNGAKIMIAGMGPAGFTLAHHLLLEGFAVVGFDGLKIEPLPEKYIHEPIYDFASLKESLDSRMMAGFGGVAEYGITVRWDKNFLKLIYISLMRRPYFQVFGSTRFGGTIKVHDAWEMGFNHFVIAVGAGLPKALPIPGSLAPGMRQANDFLMALQLGNAAKKDSLTNLQIRLPAVIIGGGLTGVDTATEVQAYYISQVEKTLARYEKLISVYGENDIRQKMDAASLEILDEFLNHGKAVRHERERAQNENVKPNFIQLIHEWGGVTIIYRRTMQESPAYVNNHEELAKALEEGIFYRECLQPERAELNVFGFVETLICQKKIKIDENVWETSQDEIRIPARAILVATGTKPNIAYEFEHRGTFLRMGSQYQHFEDVDGELTIAHGVENNKDPFFGPFTSYHHHDKRVSLIGDTHPVFHGSVVKAIASGLRTYPKILDILKNKINHSADIADYQKFRNHIAEIFSA